LIDRLSTTFSNELQQLAQQKQESLILYQLVMMMYDERASDPITSTKDRHSFDHRACEMCWVWWLFLTIFDLARDWVLDSFESITVLVRRDDGETSLYAGTKEGPVEMTKTTHKH
jgi:hypothetical protein